MKILKYGPKELLLREKDEVVDFLFENLGEFRDDREDIHECLDYVDQNSNGGNIFISKDDNQITGVVVVNNTGMKKFIPEHILVYIAVDANQRGKGIGGRLLNHVKKEMHGNIALHVEPHNPAKNLYVREGFTNKYLEMRFVK